MEFVKNVYHTTTFGCVVLLILSNFGLYFSTLFAEFVYDDSRAILSNQDLLPETRWWNLLVNDYWGTPMTHSGSHKSYRPFTVATFRLNYFLSKFQPFLYHLFNVLLHILATVQLWHLAKRYLRQYSAFCCALLFTVHPIHTEAVAGVVGRADILATVFFLASFSAYAKSAECAEEDRQTANFSIIFSVLFAVAAMLSKEHGITVVGVCAIYDIIIRHRLSVSQLIGGNIFAKEYSNLRRRIFVLGLTAGTCLSFRLWIMNFKPPEFSPADNPTAHEDCIFTRFLTFAYLAAFNAKLLIWPSNLSFDWSMDTIPPITSLMDVRNWLTLAVYGTVGFLSVNLLQSLTGNKSQDQPALCKSAKKRSPSPASAKFDINANWLDFGTKKKSTTCTSNNNNSAYVCKVEKCSDFMTNNNTGASGNVIKNSYKLKFRGGNLKLAPKTYHSENLQNYSNPRTSETALFLGLVITVLTFLPATNLLAYVGFVVAERVLYLPSVGFCLLIAAGLEKLQSVKQRKHEKLLSIGFFLVLVAFGGKTWIRNLDWKNEETLYKSGIANNPAKAYSNLGNVYSRQNNYLEAEKAYLLALKHRANMADTHYNLGTLYQETGRLDEAVVAYENAIQCRSRLAVAYLNLGLTLWTLKRNREAETRFRECSKLSSEGLKDPKSHENAKISCLYNLGRLLVENGEISEAVTVYKSAIQKLNPYYPGGHSLYNMMGEAYSKLNLLEEAEKCFKKALHLKSDHVPAHLTYGHLMLKKGEVKRAFQWFEKAVTLDPSDPLVWQHFGQFYRQTGKFQKSLECYTRALSLDKNNFDVLFSLANIYREIGNNEKAEEFYESAVSVNPRSANARSNFGAILHLNKKYKLAEAEYLKSLELSPDDSVTLGNLKKLRRILSKNAAV